MIRAPSERESRKREGAFYTPAVVDPTPPPFGGARFDLIIGNPPYLFGERRGSAAETTLHLRAFTLARGQFDTAWLFFERDFTTYLAPDGVHTFLCADALLARDE